MKPPDDITHIPKRYQNFLRWFCHGDYLEELEGDLVEQFEHNVETHNLHFAKQAYKKEVLKMIRPSVMRKWRITSDMFSPAMLRNHGKIALRNIYRHKVFSFLNVAGLAIGMTMGLLIISMITDLLRFDRFHTDADAIYRVISNAHIDNRRIDHLATTAMPLAPSLAGMAGIDEVVRVRRFFAADASIDGKILPLRGHLVDQSFLEVFSFDLVEGDPGSALQQPNAIVITQSAAEKFFQGKDPMGRVLKMGPFGDFHITGVLEDVPLHSHMQFDVLGSFSSVSQLEKRGVIESSLTSWDDLYTNYIYLKLAESQNPAGIEGQLTQIAQAQYARFDNLDVAFSLQPILSIVSGLELSNKIGPTMPRIALIILSTIALLILLSACFNYTNLSIARSLRRSTEIGVRKVVGATKRSIVFQFLLEAVFIALIALVVGVLLFYLIRPGFFSNFPRAEQFSLELTPRLVGSFIVFAVMSGLIAGVVPSLFLSRIAPVLVLKNMTSDRVTRRFTLRKVLITFQFALSIIFIVGASIAFKQYKFTLNKDLGFDQENILNLAIFETDPTVLTNEFSKLPEVTEISFSSLVAGTGSTAASWVTPEGDGDSVVAYYISSSNSYLENHHIPLLAGQAFRASSNTNEIIINETFAARMQWSFADALERSVHFNDDLYRITGVVKDFNYTHLEEPIEPFFFIQQPDWYTMANLKIASADIGHTMQRLERIWLGMEPNHAMQATFLEDEINRSYNFLKEATTLFGFLAFIAISIACLGMLGMAMYTAETKAREVSIRKVFGASVWNIFHALSSRFYRLILIAALIALPLVYLLFDKVILANFAFRIRIGPIEMLSGLILVLLLGMLSIGSQTWRAARLNPSDTLNRL